MKHTKGPWKMLHEKDGDIWVFGNSRTRAAICKFLPPQNKYIDGKTLETIDLTLENIANAQLIAAAPDLLEAAELAFSYLEHGPSAIEDPCEALQLAIAKARRGQ